MVLQNQLDSETEFLSGLLELQYGQDVEGKLKRIASKVEWAKGWPEDKKAFWNAEVFMWQHKVEKKKRELINEELKFLQYGKNLDIGCGAYSYIPSVGFDISERMLQFNDNCTKKVIGDVEKGLPFTDATFDSVTAIFVLNYVQHYQQLVLEIRRILKDNGFFIMVLSSGKVNDWQRQKEVTHFTAAKWCEILQGGFPVDFYEKEKLWFFRCRKE